MGVDEGNVQVIDVEVKMKSKLSIHYSSTVHFSK